ncbi:MAG: response regulator [Deltaproteobacteria bacterium]|nr:response regulator [Deltaproteobacteria bacterium]
MNDTSVATLDNLEATRATILIVDDQPENLEVLSKVLQPYYRVRAARSGEQALRVVGTDPKPELILLDIMMPKMNGFAVLARLREHSSTRDIPVIFVTALDASENEQQGLDMGAVDYVTKPIRPPVVLARVRTHLDLKHARDCLANQNIQLEKRVVERTRALEQSQMQVMQAEKMAAIGLLAAGVAHELNNPLAFVTSNLGTLSKYVDDFLKLIGAAKSFLRDVSEPAATEFDRMLTEMDFDFRARDTHDLLAESKDGMERMRRIVCDLRDFSRIGDQTWELADLHRGLESTINLVWNEIKYNAEVVRNYGVLPEVNCIQSQINQVFMNLLVNAAQAIEGHGLITITTAHLGEAVKIEISDTGRGIPPENISRIFEPFFTTKPVGRGTGLGLSLAYGIIKKHHGTLTVDSKVGEGTTFRIILPIDGYSS